MTFFLALAAGVPYDTARTIALADQYVDDDPDTWPLDESNPLNNLVHNADAKRRLLSYHFVLVPSQAGADGRLDPSHYGSPPAGDHYADPVSDQLNRLSGASFFAPNDCAKYQLFGEYLHAFEDTFAHRDWNDQAYGINMGIGHGIDLKNPDYTYDHQDLLGHPWHNGARTLEMEKETFDKLGAFGDGARSFGDIEAVLVAFNGIQERNGNFTEKIATLQRQLDAWVITDKKGQKVSLTGRGDYNSGDAKKPEQKPLRQRQASKARELPWNHPAERRCGLYMKFTVDKLVVVGLSPAVLGFCILTPATAYDKFESLPASIQNEVVKARQADCKPLLQEQRVPVWVTAEGSGQVCLVQDLMQIKFYDFIEGRGYKPSFPKEGVLIITRARYLDIDLRSHLVTGYPHEGTIGIRTEPDDAYIIIRNGEVLTPGLHAFGVVTAPYKDPRYVPSPDDEKPMLEHLYNFETKTYNFSKPWDYQPFTCYTLDSLKITSGGRGVIMSGAHNTLKNSTIEVDSATAAYLYGPDVVVEGNTFIVRQPVGEPIATSAILKLRDADNAVIRNNRFIFKAGLFGKAQAEAAINLLASKNVTIENNTIEGVKTLVRKDDETTLVERGNQSK